MSPAVRKFLQDAGAALEASVFDLIVVQVDAGIRLLPEWARAIDALSEEGPSESEDLAGLCALVRSWLGADLPPHVVIALPRENIEAWLLAVQTQRKRVEAVVDPDHALVRAGILSLQGGKPLKRESDYRRLALPLTRFVGDTRRVREVPELERSSIRFVVAQGWSEDCTDFGDRRGLQ